MTINNLDAANKALAAYIPLTATYNKDNLSVERMQPLLAAFNNPHKNLQAIHIAGTSGKTSTAYYMAALLQSAGKKVGLTVSPHIHTINERLQINGQPLPEAAFCSYLERFLPVVEELDVKPSFFELLIAFALWVFHEEAVDYAVLETGLGGLLDSTNAVTNHSKVCILTDIGFDHQHILGTTLSEIAAQKAGIMHKGNMAFTYQQKPEIMDAFIARAKEVGATLYVLNESDTREDPALTLSSYEHLPQYQQRNWFLAYKTYRYLQERDACRVLKSSDLEATMQVMVPGRMQVFEHHGGKKVILDGAHNQQKMQAFVASFKAQYGDKKVPVLVALKQDKAFGAVLDELLPIASKLIVTGFYASQDRPIASVDPGLLESYCHAKHFNNVTVILPITKAYQALLNEASELTIVTGSLYIVNSHELSSLPGKPA